MTLGDALRASAGYLEGKGVDSPRRDAELLLGDALGLSRLELYTQHERPLTGTELEAVRERLRRRGRREPLAYILGEWGFRTLTLKIDARALVPRPETELVVERALARIAGLDAPAAVDVGTGSGAIALSLAREHAGARVTATDVSPSALALARENADRLGVAVAFVQTHLLDGVGGPFDLVVSNPPYVGAGELAALPPELSYEPELALVDLGQTRELVRAARNVLAPGGAIVLECHEDQSRELAAVVAAAGFAGATITKDLAGRDRVVEAEWPATRSSAS